MLTRNESIKKCTPESSKKLPSGAFSFLSDDNKHGHVKRIVNIEEPSIDFLFQWSAAILITLAIIKVYRNQREQ